MKYKKRGEMFHTEMGANHPGAKHRSAKQNRRETSRILNHKPKFKNIESQIARLHRANVGWWLVGWYSVGVGLLSNVGPTDDMLAWKPVCRCWLCDAGPMLAHFSKCYFIFNFIFIWIYFLTSNYYTYLSIRTSLEISYWLSCVILGIQM